MATININITGINRDDSLILRTDSGGDASDIVASRGDYIQWVIGSNSGVATISSIHDTSAVNIFSNAPGKEDGTQSWEGRVDPGLTGLPKSESYCIYYTKPGSSLVYTHDPRIQVRS